MKISRASFYVLMVFLGVCFLVIYPRVYGYIEGIFDALRPIEIQKEYSAKSNDRLLDEMDSYNWKRAHVAYGILVDRKEKRAIPKIVKKMKKEKENESMYIQALASIGDKSVIPIILNSISNAEKKSQNEVYWEGNIALAKFQYAPAWETAVELSRSLDVFDLRLAMDMFEAFGDKRAIPYLEDIRVKRKNMGEEIVIKEDGRDMILRIFSVEDVDKIVQKLRG